MKISCKWLKEYVHHDLSPEQVADIITNTGLEVEEIEFYSNFKNLSDKLIIGFVREVNKHPDADKLTVCKVDIGTGNDLQIICGAPNVAIGQKVVVAPVGTELISVRGDKLVLKEAKIRGIVSQGMICAEDELGIGTDHTGIIVLTGDAETGKNYKEYLGVYEDDILEVAITPNRGDALSHIGVARDLAAVLEKKISYPSVENFKIDENSSKVDAILEDKELCTRYSGIVVSGIKISESPEWLQNKLKSIGLKPVNNIVDVTNFVLNETGQPLHAFDLGKIEGDKIIVKQVTKGTQFKTLTGVEVKLNGTEIMICDAVKPVAIGGVMGGYNSMITENTTTIFIESACFDPRSIRRTSKYHGITTDASFRFERGSDPDITIFAMKRAASLIREIAGGKITSGIIDEYPGKKENLQIDLYYDYVENLSGNDLDKSKLKTILENLEYVIVEETEDHLRISVPSYRWDVTRPVDLVEEFLRIYSYEKISFTNEFISSLPVEKGERKTTLLNRIINYLISEGFYELFSASFINSENSNINETGNIGAVIRTLNAKNSNFDTLKANIVISGLESISFNVKRNNSNLRFFEFSKSYYSENGKYFEKEKLGLWITGNRYESGWYEKDKEIDFYQLKMYLENILKIAGLFKEIQLSKIQHDLYTDLYDVLYNNKKIAQTGLLNQEILLSFDIKNKVFFAEIEVETLVNENADVKIMFKPPCRFPFIMRDLSLALGENVLFSEIKDVILSVKNKYLKEIKVADVYKGEQVGTEKKSYLVRLKFQDEEQTLKDEQVDKIISQIIKLVENRFNATVRQ